ncbi:hypothetical protein TNCV_333531 [Trichonephila clavipes]|nr:hypothetical protein TNCV_333531 [Trichonephila clavipes]
MGIRCDDAFSSFDFASLCKTPYRETVAVIGRTSKLDVEVTQCHLFRQVPVLRAISEDYMRVWMLRGESLVECVNSTFV